MVAARQQVNAYFLKQVQGQVNTALTLRNWIIGYYIVEYGQKLYKVIADNLKSKGLKSFGERNLYLCKDFYLTYTIFPFSVIISVDAAEPVCIFINRNKQGKSFLLI
ncbi:MAG: hypothetical protein ICV51_18595 [Flavisolibacter sp.]|nr:hypothetical protein [Flavisolibacter sp.]